MKTVFFKVEDLCSDVYIYIYIYLIECKLWILFLFFFMIFFFFNGTISLKFYRGKFKARCFFYKSSSFLKSVKFLMVDSRTLTTNQRKSVYIIKFYSFFPPLSIFLYRRYTIEKKEKKKEKKIGRYLYINCTLSLEIKLFSFNGYAML